jgi:hypothetical protein
MLFKSNYKILSGLLILLLVVLVGGPSTINAEAVVVGTATATILAALTVTADQSLIFGTDVLQGVPRTIANNVNASSAIFRIAGNGGSDVWASLTLPTYMSHTTSSSDRMDIYFSATDGAYDLTDGGAALPADGTSTNYNPWTSTSQTLSLGGDMAIFLGGTIRPKVNQTAGAYSADIILTVAYIGT